jgi:hypothetical protein
VRTITKSTLLAGIAVLAACKVAQIHFLLRPVVLSFLLFGTVYLLILALIKSWQHQSVWWQRRRYCWVLPLLFAFWANLHPFFLLGLILLALWPISILVAEYFKITSGSQRSELFFSSMLWCACALATLINPYFFNLHLSILNLGASDFFMNYHMEWGSPNFDELEGKITEFFSMLFLLALVARVWPVNSVERVFYVIALALFAHGSLQAIRILPFYMLVLTVPWVQAMRELSNAAAKQPVLRLLNQFRGVQFKYYFGWISSSVVTVLSVLLVFKIYIPTIVGISEKKFPHEVVDFFDSQGINKQNPIGVLAPPSWGGFFTWMSRGKLEPLLDDRNTLVGEELYKSYHEAEKDLDKMRTLMDRFAIKYLVLPRKHPIDCYLRHATDFEVLHDGAVAGVFYRE